MDTNGNISRFQEALDWLKTRENWNGMCYEELQVDVRYQNRFDTLQELIDQQADYMSYQDLKVEYEQELNRYKKELDMACEILSSLSSCDCLHKRLYENKIFKGSDRKEYVKKTIEYLLKESEKQ